MRHAWVSRSYHSFYTVLNVTFREPVEMMALRDSKVQKVLPALPAPPVIKGPLGPQANVAMMVQMVSMGIQDHL